MKLNITVDHYQELIKKSYSLDLVYLLGLIHEGYDVTPLCDSSVKIKAIYNSLLRKQMITKEEKLTTLGVDILDFINKKSSKKFIKKKIEKSEFDEWWEIYPLTDEFMMGSKRFAGTRGLRVNKEKCRLEFTKILEEGVFTKEEIIECTLYDIRQRKSNSLKQARNNLSYIQNSHTYLNQRSFEPFLSLVKSPQKFTDSKNLGSLDI